MPLAEANHSFVPVIYLDAISRSQSFVHPGHPLRMTLAEANHQPIKHSKGGL
jgi:hypothetical protein